MMTEDTAEKLGQVVRVLEGLPLYKRFDINVWHKIKLGNPGHCGTTCCAIGWSALDQWFNEKGLHLKDENSWGRNIPAYKAFRGFGAVTEFFKISENVAEYLFIYNSYPADPPPTKHDMIARIQYYIAKKGDPQ